VVPGLENVQLCQKYAVTGMMRDKTGAARLN